LAPAEGIIKHGRAAPRAARFVSIAIVVVIPTILAIALLLGRSSSDPEASPVTASLRRFEQAVRDHDLQAMRALSTDKFYRDYFKLSGSAGIFAEDNPELAIGRPVTRKVESISIEGDKATIAATVAGADALNVDSVEVRLVNVDGAWLMDALAMRTSGSSGSAQLLDLTMRDFAFAPEPVRVGTGSPLVIRAKNVGSQPHMVGVWKVPDGANLIKTIEATEGIPPGVERIVQSTTFAPGDQGDISVSRGLRPGRYMLTCFLSDITSQALTPHYDLGMLTEFTVK